MGFLRVSCGATRRTTSAPPGQNTRQGQIPRRAPIAPSHHSNAPIRQESQSILSKIVALMPRQLTSDSRQNPSAAFDLLHRLVGSIDPADPGLSRRVAGGPAKLHKPPANKRVILIHCAANL